MSDTHLLYLAALCWGYYLFALLLIAGLCRKDKSWKKK